MEAEHRKKIVELYKTADLPPIEVLDIPDEYECMDQELMQILTERINASLKLMYDF